MFSVSSMSWVTGMSFAFAVVFTVAALFYYSGTHTSPGVVCPNYVWQELGIDPSAAPMSEGSIAAIARQYAEHGCVRETQADADAVAGWYPLDVTPYTLLDALLGLALGLGAVGKRQRRKAAVAGDEGSRVE